MALSHHETALADSIVRVSMGQLGGVYLNLQSLTLGSRVISQIRRAGILNKCSPLKHPTKSYSWSVKAGTTLLPKNLGCCVNKNQMQWFTNHTSSYLNANRTMTTYEMLKLRNLIVLWEIYDQFDASNTFEKSWYKGSIRLDTLCNAKTKHLIEYLAAN